jgi:hypothetical protein
VKGKKFDVVEVMDRIERREILDRDRDVTPETVWIVDYDLPADNRRRQFYREIQRFKKKTQRNDDVNWSTQSVVITPDREFAEFVYERASQLGHANLYQAKQLKGNNHSDVRP